MCILTILCYNKLVKLRERADNSWSQIDVQLQKRFDLVPNLVETVKGYAKHEKTVLTEVTQARASVGSAKTQEEVMEANNQLTGALSRLLVVVERYPELKANENFLSLQGELKNIESAIAYSRQFYNDSCMLYNQKIKLFPCVIIAKIFKFKEKPYFDAVEETKIAPKVSFD
ncbi:MAG: LemA family protein [Christensenellales bacterium]|mgnify:FL=1